METYQKLSTIESLIMDYGSKDLELVKEFQERVQTTIGLENSQSIYVMARSEDAVVEIIRLCNQFKKSIYPTSRGCNWGLGARLPASSDSIILDLSEMNQILEVNTEQSYIVVEPGVSFKQVHDYLTNNNLDYIIDVTGSSADSSVLGNVLDGGVGYFNFRFEDSLAFNVILGNGEKISTGFSHFKKNKSGKLFKYGVGPTLDGLFMQSNFGVVTSMAIRLRKKPSYHLTVSCKIKSQEHLVGFVACLSRLKKEGVIQTIPKIGNQERNRTTLCPLMNEVLRSENLDEAEALFQKYFGGWSALIVLHGNKQIVKASVKIVKKALKPYATCFSFSQKKIQTLKSISKKLSFIDYFKKISAVLHSVDSLFELTLGKPSYKTLPSLYWGNTKVPDNYSSPTKHAAGMIAYLPILPANSVHLESYIERINQVTLDYGFKVNITMSLVNQESLWGVIDLSYNKSDPIVKKRAINCINYLTKEMLEEGIVPQRIGIQDMHEILDEKSSYWRTIKDFKIVLDPNNVISPKRYNLI